MVRDGPDTVWASAACSVGRKTLTSPEEGFRVPAIVTTMSGQNAVNPAKPKPVRNISAAAPSRTPLRDRRYPSRPTPSVTAADPSNVPVTIAPTSNGHGFHALAF
jgi:hypothetical protein